MPWDLKITRAENGWVLSWEEDGNIIYKVVEETFDCEYPSIGMSVNGGFNLLQAVQEYYDFIGSKHDKHRVKVIITGIEEE